MIHNYPIYTVDAECQDCFKCVRQCPVKAIRVQGAHASVIPELCIACGNCVQVCPVHAKKVRSDWDVAKRLLKDQTRPVYVSLAPSWVNEFKGLSSAKMIAALKRLGFAGVSETALGAQIVTERSAVLLAGQEPQLMVSSACPVVVDFIRKYYPGLTKLISPVLSPALAHAKFLQEQFGPAIKVVFIGPCIGKKNESDKHPDSIAVAMLFTRLRQWFRDENINPYATAETADDVFVPFSAREGALYPIEGGMNTTISKFPGCENINFVSIAGLEALRQTLNGLHPGEVRAPVFLEALACVGGCVHGPGTEHNSPGLLERLRVLRQAEVSASPTLMRAPDISEEYLAAAVSQRDISLREIQDALSSIGKTSSEQEINCGGCGYCTCHNFAQALIEGKAEPNMCVSYLRKLAQKKSNAMLRCIPAAVVIVDRNLTVLESNKRFADLAGGDIVELYTVLPGLAGLDLRRSISFYQLFEQVLVTGEEYQCDTFKLGERLLSITIFNIDPKQVVGAIIFDVTTAELRREEIAERAQEVIEKNLSTVQEIACKLGEHMAETELLLRSIAEKYSDHQVLGTGGAE